MKNKNIVTVYVTYDPPKILTLKFLLNNFCYFDNYLPFWQSDGPIVLVWIIENDEGLVIVVAVVVFCGIESLICLIYWHVSP